MIDHNLPPIPELTMTQITILLQHMQPEDVKVFNEYCMLHFPNWLFKIVKREAELSTMSFESFVHMACINEVVKRVKGRSNEANGNIQISL